MTNREELRAARKSTDELTKAAEALDDELVRNARTQAELRKEMNRLRKERAEGKGDKKKLREEEAKIRVALAEQAEAAKAAKEALRNLRAEQRAAAADAKAAAKTTAQAAREQARAQAQAAREQARAAREAAQAQVRAAREAAQGQAQAQRGAARAAKDAAQGQARAAKAERDLIQRIGGDSAARLGPARDRAVGAYKAQYKADQERNFTRGLAKSARERFKDATSPDAALDSLGGAASGVSSAARTGLKVGAGALAGGGLALGIGAASVGMQFEDLRTALATTEGSAAKAKEAFARIRAFAKATPFDVQGVTEAFIKLKNRGLDASEPALRAYGDTASAMGKSLDDMIEAVADAATGEFERLKEFGVKASAQGDKVKFTFRGVTTEVAKDSASIEQYLIKLGQTNFGGGMEAMSKTLAGTLGGLADSVKMFLDEIFRGEFGTALKEVAADLGLFADGASSAALAISGALATAVRELWSALKELLGDPADLGERIAGWATTIGEFLIKAGELLSFAMSLAEAIGGDNIALLAFGAAILGLVGPFGAVLAAWTALGAWLASTFLRNLESSEQALRNMAQAAQDMAEHNDALAGFKDSMVDLARSTDEGAAAFGRLMLKIAGSRSALEDLENVERKRREDAARAAEAEAKGWRLGDAREAEARRRNAAAKAASEGMASRGLGAQQAKLKRYKELGKKKHLSPSEQKELQAIRKELDLPTPSHEKHKPESAYEADREAEIKKHRQQAERRAGFRAQLSGATAAEQLRAAKAAGDKTEARLRDSTRAGGALPGELNVGVLRAAGFDDVAGAGQPPPVAVTIVKVPEFQVQVNFSGPVQADLRMVREEIDKVIARTLPEQLADGLRNVKWPTLY